MTMKKAGLVALLLTLGCVMTSQAVVIGWAAENLNANTAYARLIYVASGSQPSLDGSGNWSDGVSMVSDYATGYAIDGTSLNPQQTTDLGERGESGKYFVVLFNTGFTDYAVSTTSLAWDDQMIGTGDLDPVGGYFTPSTFTTWSTIPEPSTAMLLMVGAAVAALRRRKHV